MQLRYLKTILSSSSSANADSINLPKIAYITTTPLRTAVATSDRAIILFDEDGNQREKFPTKAADKAVQKHYVLRGIQFSPDGTKLAIGQSDNIVFIYKLGSQWNDKKTICNKFVQTSPITSLIWPSSKPTDLLFSCANGKIRIGKTLTNKSTTLYQIDAYPTQLACSPDGESMVSAHSNGAIYRYSFADVANNSTATLLCYVTFVPLHLAWSSTNHLIVAGNSSMVKIIDMHTGQSVQSFDVRKHVPENSNSKPNESNELFTEFTSIALHPSGETFIIGGFSTFFTFVFSQSKLQWEIVNQTIIDNLLAVTSMGWRHDGNCCLIGSLRGNVDVFEGSVRKMIYKNAFEFVYSSLSSVVIKKLNASHVKLYLQSQTGNEIGNIQVYQNRFAVARTKTTLLLGDTYQNIFSEIRWNHGSEVSTAATIVSKEDAKPSEKFIFENENTCVVYANGEITIVEYGKNEPLCTARTDKCNSSLISVRNTESTKKFAYLLDSHSIRILDIRGNNSIDATNTYGIMNSPFYSAPEITLTHHSKINWMDFNFAADKLLFRDRLNTLYICNLQNLSTTSIVSGASKWKSNSGISGKTDSTIINAVETLMPNCIFAQWVPEANVVVAQNQSLQLCVYYAMNTPEDVTIIPVKGKAESVYRCQATDNQAASTEVHLLLNDQDESSKEIVYLDDTLIAFSTAIDKNELLAAMQILETRSSMSGVDNKASNGSVPNFSSFWAQLAKISMSNQEFSIAERCYSALKDTAKVNFLQKINSIISQTGDKSHFLVKFFICVMQKQFRRGEAIMIQNNAIDYLIHFYCTVHKWEDAINVAQQTHYHNQDSLRAKYFAYLMDTHQEAKAADWKLNLREFESAIDLYLKGSRPQRAAEVLLSQNLLSNISLTQNVMRALERQKCYESLGDIHNACQEQDKALDKYILSSSFHKAIELARKLFPARVVELEGKWGDFCMQSLQYDLACSHYIQANLSTKAIAAALEGKNFTKAQAIFDQSDLEVDKTTFAPRLAEHFKNIKQYSIAEKYYLMTSQFQEILLMYFSDKSYDKAYSFAIKYLSEADIHKLFLDEAKKLEKANEDTLAEKAFILAKEYDRAIAMYTRTKSWDNLIRLIDQYRPESSKETNLMCGRQLEAAKQYKQAEEFYVASGEWQTCIQMYHDIDRWEDLLRVAKSHGGKETLKQWAYQCALQPNENAAKLISKKNLTDFVLEYAIEHGEFAEAFKIGEKLAPQKIPDIHLNYAMALEDNGEFLKAEEHFILAKKPREAIDMYTHQQDWESAMRIAEQHDKSAVSEIYDAQAKLYRSQRQFNQAEQLYLGAKKPEQAIEMYVEANLFDDAIRVARIHCPRLLAQIEHDKRTYARIHVPGMENSGLRSEIGLKMEQESKMPSRYQDDDDDENDRIAQIQKKKAGGAQSSQDILEGFAQNGEWARVFETLQSTKLFNEEMRNEIRLEYSSRHAHELVSQEKYVSALRGLDKYGFALDDTFFPLYKRLATEVLSRAGVVMEDMNDETYLEHIQTRPTDELALMIISQLRRLLYKLHTDLRTSDPHCHFLSELEVLLYAAHFYMLRLQSGNVNVPQLSLKQSISCLRYANLLPVDKVFHEAGSASKDNHIENMAFVCWNRFVDIMDIWYSEQGQQSDIDNSDFVMTDIPTPFDTPMPKFTFYTEEKVEDVRQWILEKAMSVTNAHQLSMNKCEKCHADMYEGTLHCPHCQTQYSPCVVTGYPVFRSKKVNCSLCNAVSNREDWNRYVNKTKQCAWCSGPQTPYY